MRDKRSLAPDYFENMFRETADPWDLETSSYEASKYADTIAALAGRAYRQGIEIGCAKGVLTQQLARHCDRLLAIDVSETALTAARERCAHLPSISFSKMTFPLGMPRQTQFDLVVLSEVAYYWDDADLARTALWVINHVSSGGDVLLVHWTGETDYPQSGDDAVEKLGSAIQMPISVLRAERRNNYRLDLWRREP
jgi:predicted TPR repeat methyltransferase